MFNSFARRLSRRIGHVLKFLSPEEVDDSLLESEKNLYKRNIIREARNFEMFDDDLISPATLAEAINIIGSLAYTGGPPANKCAGTYIPKLAELLSRPDLRNDVRVAILKSLSTITINHSDHQNLAFQSGLLKIVADIIVKTTEGVQLWAIYCLYCLVLDHIRNLQAIKSDVSVHDTLRASAKMSWSGFRHNYADVLLKLAGLEPVTRQKKADLELSNGDQDVKEKKTIQPKLTLPSSRKGKLKLSKSKLEKIDE